MTTISLAIESRWTIVSAPYKRNHATYVRAQCRCGTEREVLKWNIDSGHSLSCGCLRLELFAARSTTHGMADHPVYDVWQAMIQRCTNPNNKRWADYGGRGITVCDEWRVFENFWRDMGPRPDGLTLERIDVNKGYEPSNCCWATRSQQSANRRLPSECRNGHEYTPENTAHVSGRSGRVCRTCRAEAKARHAARKGAKS